MKRNNILLKGYKSTKSMAKGGLTKPFSNETAGLIAAGGTIADGLIDGIDLIDEFGTRTGVGATASGAVKGAMAGAALGPLGIAGGAVIGGITSLLGNKKAQEAKQNTLTQTSNNSAKLRADRVNERVANNPDLLYGRQMKMGGTIAGKPAKKFSLRPAKVSVASVDLMPDIAVSPNKIARFAEGGEIDPKKKKKPTTITTKQGNTITDEDLTKVKTATQIPWESKEQYGEFLDTFAKPLPTISNSTVTYPFGRRGETMTQDEWDFSRKKRGYPDVYADKRQGTDNFAPGESFANEIRNDIKEFRAKTKKMETGGFLRPTSSRTSSVVGPKHADGGVKLKDMNVEVEGGESMSDDFVFSERLGIADIHKQIGKSMGANEKRPQTPLNMKTQEALVRKEGFLKIYQEEKKKSMGLPNEIDNTIKGIKKAQRTGDVTIMANGGKLPKKAIGGPYKKKLNLSLKPEGEAAAAVDGVTDKTTIKDIVTAAAPFASNIANAFRRLPAPPKPVMDEELGTPSLINLEASRSEAVRARRGADKSIEQSNTSSNAVSATKAANMVQQTRSINDINQAEQNANAQIKNQVMGANAQIRRGNSLKQDFYNQQQVERQLKQQSLDSENIADVGNKIQAIQRDKNMTALDDDKMLLTIAQDNTGATIRSGDAILKRRLSPDGYRQMKELGTKLEQAAAEDRTALMAQARMILDQAKPVTNTILADSDAQKNKEKSELNSARVNKLLEDFKKSKK